MPQKAYEYRHVVSFEETNLLGNVYFTHFIRWQGLCRESFLRDKAPEVLEEFDNGLRLATTRVSCDYFRELEALDEVVICMSLSELTQSEITMSFEYFCHKRGGLELVARGEQRVASLRKEGGRWMANPLPALLRDALGVYVKTVTS